MSKIIKNVIITAIMLLVSLNIETRFLNYRLSYSDLKQEQVTPAQDLSKEGSKDKLRIINLNIPEFSQDEINKAKSCFEEYYPLDDLGRCTGAMASVGLDIMPIEQRLDISNIYPTGWNNDYYDDIGWIYNRCHLIAFCLAGENDNELNLITGTQYLNENMYPYEVEIVRYCERTGNHVLYKVIPDFKDDELVCQGIYMMAQSIEDNEIVFNIYLSNIQPGYDINYKTGQTNKING